MTHLPILVLSTTRVRSVALVLSLYLTRSCWQALLPDMTHSINDKTISGLGSFWCIGSLSHVDSFACLGSLGNIDSLCIYGSLTMTDSFTMRGSLGRYDSFA